MENSRRYDKQIALAAIGASGQEKLASARVLVIGAGGLGCPVLQNLAAAGVGQIGIVDGDAVEATNLHRQLLYTPNDCGKNKAQVAAMAVLKQNPEVKVFAFAYHFTKENAFEIIENYQLIVDCTDDNHTRYLINDVALAKNIPMVYASIHQFEGQLSVFNFKAGPSYRCLFPQPEKKLKDSNCNDSGVLGVLPQTLGILQATEVLKIILGIGEVLSGKLLLYDGLQYGFRTIAFGKNPSEIEKGLQNGNAILSSNAASEIAIGANAFFEALENNTHLVIDIRENYEQPKLENHGIHNIPLDQLEHFIATVAKNQSVILFCQRGHNSKMAADYLIKKGFGSIHHLQNGIESLDFIQKTNE
jgi:molybdopterin/thiamine biosynthesis adenylyltransferase/rhodanese-related sulfurtransferase